MTSSWVTAVLLVQGLNWSRRGGWCHFDHSSSKGLGPVNLNLSNSPNKAPLAMTDCNQAIELQFSVYIFWMQEYKQ